MGKIECPECKGEGMVKDPCGLGSLICPRCKGTGEIEESSK